MADAMSHDKLALDLAAHLRGNTGYRCWVDMQLGPSGSPRPDVWCLPASYSRFTPLSYEVKVSVADFRRDVTAGKWQSYMAFSAGVIFATPHGLIGPKDVPAGCGLITRLADGSWRHSKRPTLSRLENLPLEVWMKLVIDGCARQHQEIRARHASEYSLSQKTRERLGETVASVVRDMAGAQALLASVREQTKAEEKVAEERAKRRSEEFKRNWVESVEPGIHELMRELGVESSPPSYWEITSAITRVRGELRASETIRKAAAEVSRAQMAINRANETLIAALATEEARESKGVG